MVGVELWPLACNLAELVDIKLLRAVAVMRLVRFVHDVLDLAEKADLVRFHARILFSETLSRDRELAFRRRTQNDAVRVDLDRVHADKLDLVQFPELYQTLRTKMMRSFQRPNRRSRPALEILE